MEYLWNPATALKEIKDGLVNIDKRLLPVDEVNSGVHPSFLFSHGSKYMSVVFLGASWKIEFPVRLKVQTGAKLYRQLVEQSEGSWEIGEISSTTKEANLMISRHFWYPPTFESIAFIQNIYVGGTNMSFYPKSLPVNSFTGKIAKILQSSCINLRAILQGLGEMRGLNGLAPDQIGNGAGQFEHTMKGAGAEL
jgi:hypothetical protein